MARDPASHFAETNNVLVDAIRNSDFKANVALIFVAIMMGPVIGARDKFPSYFSLPIVLAPFLIVYFCLLLCLLPRYPRMGRVDFVVRHNAAASLFPAPEDEAMEVERLRTLCAISSRILYWKNLMLQISYYICIITVGAIAVLVVFYWLRL
jgi:hypothetical protein